MSLIPSTLPRPQHVLCRTTMLYQVIRLNFCPCGRTFSDADWLKNKKVWDNCRLTWFQKFEYFGENFSYFLRKIIKVLGENFRQFWDFVYKCILSVMYYFLLSFLKGFLKINPKTFLKIYIQNS